ncbi:LysR family transcriptional regulator [Ruegeria sp. 1NDH52C]|uniref:LysR family transcriptional regulator n=1 Tax=Ruegeria alba TaxID=2916756 RepID=A0ABS9NXF9_9RHOB|nr:LysR family transcriptional regulator [Ruegeria alba]MCE8555792.1 LysR family transcriptional regulator [Ruegeria pomeroyi]MCG6558912.1 LysR family transcriptional regulator [Ruegeria alba]
MIKIEMLRCFSTVAQTGNLADAAMRMGRTQSALSMTLKQLEEHLGQRLFENERKNRLTPLGQEVFRFAQQQLRQFDDTIQAIEAAARAPQGLLRVASIPSASGLALPGAIETMMQRHPSLDLELRDMDSGRVVDAILQGQADLGIVSGQPVLNGVESETLFEDAYGLLCATGHPLAQQPQAPDIDAVFASGFIRNSLCGLIEAPEIRAALPRARITVHNTHSLLAMVRTGKWVTILPRSVARVQPTELTFRPIAGLEEQRSVSLLIHTRTQFPQLVAEFADILRHSPWTG